MEYIKGEDEFLDVTIKEQKGLFSIIEIIDDEGNSSTRLARQKELRCINYISLDDLLEDKYANIYFEIPPELSSWIDSDKFKGITDKIRDEIFKDCENSELFIVSYPEEEDSLFLRVLCNSEKKDFVKLFMGKAIEGEKILTSVNRDKENSKKELEDVKKKNKTFFIPQKFVGLIKEFFATTSIGLYQPSPASTLRTSFPSTTNTKNFLSTSPEILSPS